MTALGLVVSALSSAALVVLFAASARHQFHTVGALALRRRPPLKLLRQYRLFAPRPQRSDLHLLVRDVAADGTPGPCRQIPLTPLRRWRHLLWNPDKRRWLPLVPMHMELATASTVLGNDRAAVQLSTPYLILLDLVCTGTGPEVAARQFLLVERFGHAPARDPVVVFCSAVHRVDRAAEARTAR